MLEQIQRRAIQLITGLKELSYEERVKERGLTTLETVLRFVHVDSR